MNAKRATSEKAKERRSRLLSGGVSYGGERRDFYPTTDYPEPGGFPPFGRHIFGQPNTIGPDPAEYAAKVIRTLLPREKLTRD